MTAGAGARSSILDGNSFDAGRTDGDPLSATDAALVARRRRVLGPSYRLFYRRPLHVVRAAGTRMWDAEGREYLDAYNNVVSIGHAHPAVVAAVHRQLGTLNTHSRYLQRGILDYAEQLVGTFPAGLDTVMFTNSGSEANDLALRVARHVTGGTGVVVTAEAYHGTTSALAEVSPAAGAPAPGSHTAVVCAPDAYRRGAGPGLGQWFAGQVTEAFGRLRARGITPAALLLDTVFASDGVHPDPHVLAPAAAAARTAGALVVADEVQPGFARIGAAFWGFARHRVEPDLVSLGKPMGNGIPVAALVGRGDLLASFGDEVPYFNTFGGSSVPVAAAQAVLDVITTEGLAQRSEELGTMLRAGMTALAAAHPVIGDIRGAGLFLGVELVRDPTERSPDAALATDVVNTLRDLGVLVSLAGPDSNVLKIRPLLVSTDADIALLVDRLDEALTRCAAALCR